MKTNRFTIGIIGTGTMADIYTAILRQRPDCEVVAVVGNSAAKTSEFAGRHAIAGYADGAYETMYRTHPDIDVTVVATPEWVRIDPVRVAVEYRQHILLEKPFAAGLEEALELAQALDGHPGVVKVCHVLRHSPRFFALQRAVADGSIGELRHIYARRNSNSRRVTRVLGRTDLAYWLTPHDADIMRWITGSEVSEVFARSRSGLHSADDYLIANLRFADGVDAVLEISWCSPPLSGAAREALFEAWGTAGSIELEDFNMNVKVFGEGNAVTTPDTYEDFAVHGLRRGFFENMIASFIDSIVANDVSNTTIRDGVESIRICEMIRQSLDQGAVIRREG